MHIGPSDLCEVSDIYLLGCWRKLFNRCGCYLLLFKCKNVRLDGHAYECSFLQKQQCIVKGFVGFYL